MWDKTPEQRGYTPERKEREHISSKIFLVFFRHSIRYEPPLEDSLTPEGRRLAKEKAKEYHPEEVSPEDIRWAVAFGSPRIRTQETAGFILGGAREEITGEESLEELREKINRGLRYGSKIGVDKRLSIYIDNETLYGQKAIEAYKRGEFLKFLVEESDRIAEESGDKTSSTYSRLAAQVAEIVQKYIRVSKRWNELVHQRKHYSTILERYLCSHESVLESFLAKVIEKTLGIEARNRFIQVLGNRGFDYLEGFRVEIINTIGGDPENPEIVVSYQKKDREGNIIFDFNVKINKELIEEIIQEGQK